MKINLKSYIPMIFFISMFSILIYSIYDFTVGVKDDKLLNDCGQYSVSHTTKSYKFLFGKEKITYEIELNNGKRYIVSKQVYDEIINNGCAEKSHSNNWFIINNMIYFYKIYYMFKERINYDFISALKKIWT